MAHFNKIDIYLGVELLELISAGTPVYLYQNVLAEKAWWLSSAWSLEITKNQKELVLRCSSTERTTVPFKYDSLYRIHTGTSKEIELVEDPTGLYTWLYLISNKKMGPEERNPFNEFVVLDESTEFIPFETMEDSCIKIHSHNGKELKYHTMCWVNHNLHRKLVQKVFNTDRPKYCHPIIGFGNRFVPDNKTSIAQYIVYFKPSEVEEVKNMLLNAAHVFGSFRVVKHFRSTGYSIRLYENPGSLEIKKPEVKVEPKVKYTLDDLKNKFKK